MAGTRTRTTRDRVVAPGTRLAVLSAMVKIEIVVADIEVWRALKLAAVGVAVRHARRARPEVARRFAAAAVALQRAAVEPAPPAGGVASRRRRRASGARPGLHTPAGVQGATAGGTGGLLPPSQPQVCNVRK